MIHLNFSPTFWNMIPFISREWMRNCNFKCMKTKSWIYWVCMHKESILFTEQYFKWSYLQNLCLCIYHQADVTKSFETPVIFPLLLMKQTCKEGVKYISINFSFFHIAESIFYLLLWFPHYIKCVHFLKIWKWAPWPHPFRDSENVLCWVNPKITYFRILHKNIKALHGTVEFSQ